MHVFLSLGIGERVDLPEAKWIQKVDDIFGSEATETGATRS